MGIGTRSRIWEVKIGRKEMEEGSGAVASRVRLRETEKGWAWEQVIIGSIAAAFDIYLYLL